MLFFRDVAGAAALELALIAPLLAALTLGLTDTGRAIGQRMQLIDAAQQGIQFGQLRNPIGDDVSGVLAAIGPGKPEHARNTTIALYCECVIGTQVACSITCPENALLRRYLDITITENYNTLFPYPFIGAAVPLQAHAVSRLQ